LSHTWIDLNDHCKRAYLGNEYFVDAESSAIHRRIVGIDKKYALYKAGASRSGCALRIGTSNKFREVYDLYLREIEESA
jgi:hypothetical protein